MLVLLLFDEARRYLCRRIDVESRPWVRSLHAMALGTGSKDKRIVCYFHLWRLESMILQAANVGLLLDITAAMRRWCKCSRLKEVLLHWLGQVLRLLPTQCFYCQWAILAALDAVGWVWFPLRISYGCLSRPRFQFLIKFRFVFLFVNFEQFVV